ncbi:hypothetical protein LPJ61_002419 [Coemansia biformis]|uniref:Sugar phosphate transporter domain-containing protein n=1 Tax=Coemansia biformis TaxID=1286918 RepID=A0A9W7Y8D9_9FUNG|nr:hypothetical protein LPJ61_002419 [Coemansia biformis]
MQPSSSPLPPPPATSVLLIKLPRHVVDALQTAAAGSLRLALGGKERITTGTLFVGNTQHDVRYSSERSSAPPLVFQGGSQQPAGGGGGGWARWTQRGKVVGKLTVVHRAKAAGAASAHWSTAAVAAEPRAPAPAGPAAAAAVSGATESQAAPAKVSQEAEAAMAAAAAKTVPQKKPGILRQNREMLRDRVLHMLARGPMEEERILDEISSPQGVVLEVLGSLAAKAGAEWSLLPDRFRLVQVESWPKYDAQTRARVANSALDAFNALGLPADDPDRLRMQLVQQRLARGESATAAPPLLPPPPPRKKPVRSVIAPTLPKKVRVEAAKSVRRVPDPVASGGHSTPVSAEPKPDLGAKERPRSTGRPTPLAAAPADDASVAPARRPMASAPSTAPNTAVGRLSLAKDTDAARRSPSLDVEPKRRVRPRQRSSPPARSRSRSQGPHTPPVGRSRASADTNADTEQPGHRRVRSRPLQLQALVGARTGMPEAETGAAVGRVQERLAQMGDRRSTGPPASARSRSSSDVRQKVPRRARGPSLSPIADQRPSPSPSPPPRIEQVETVDDLQELQRQLVSLYAEYSQLRLNIDDRCAAFASLTDELAAAQAACAAATARMQHAGQVDREEGEEDPGDQRGEPTVLGTQPTTTKLALDGSRLYWRDMGGTSWLSDSPDAIVGRRAGRDGQPCRTQQLLPEEARVLRATQAIASQYAELDCNDVRRRVRRYLSLHAHIERMDRELGAAYQRIAAGISAQYDALRADLGDATVDAALARSGREPAARILTLDMYRSDEAASERVPRERGPTALLHTPGFRRHILLCGLYLGLWYVLSGLLSVYNKWLFGATERNFPFPLFVTSVQMLAQFALARLCLRLRPALQPTQTPTWDTYLTRAVPCGVASALDIGLSNISLRTITLTFLTMCKSSGLGFLLLFAFLFGLERVRLVLVAIIAVISAGVVLMAAGEVDFALAGFLEAIGSAAMSGLRWSLTQILLSQARFGMNNPVATMINLTPIVGTTTLVLSLILENPFAELAHNSNTDSLRGALSMAFVMVAGGLVAFGMVYFEFLLIARTSALTFSIAGMLKEVALVSIAHVVFGDTMTALNASGLLVTLFGIGMYNWLKIHDVLAATKAAGPEDGAGVDARWEEDRRLRQAAAVADPYDEAFATAATDSYDEAFATAATDPYDEVVATAATDVTLVERWPGDGGQPRGKAAPGSSSESNGAGKASAGPVSPLDQGGRRSPAQLKQRR